MYWGNPENDPLLVLTVWKHSVSSSDVWFRLWFSRIQVLVWKNILSVYFYTSFYHKTCFIRERLCLVFLCIDNITHSKLHFLSLRKKTVVFTEKKFIAQKSRFISPPSHTSIHGQIYTYKYYEEMAPLLKSTEHTWFLHSENMKSVSKPSIYSIPASVNYRILWTLKFT